MPALPTVILELIPDPEQGGFTAHIIGIPAYGEGETEEEAITDLKGGVQAYIEENGLEETLAGLRLPPQIRQVNLGDLVTHE